MDTSTQAVLGAAVGQALFGHRLGRRAAVWGAVGGLIPDLDMLAVLATGAWGEFVLHRGPSHSLLFAPVFGPLLGLAVWRFHSRRRAVDPGAADRDGHATRHPGDPERRGTWMWLFTAALFTHPLLDVFTSYGTQLLAPFSRQRFACDAVGIIDPGRGFNFPQGLTKVTADVPWPESGNGPVDPAEFVRGHVAPLRAVCDRAAKEMEVWVQGIRIPAGEEAVILRFEVLC